MSYSLPVRTVLTWAKLPALRVRAFLRSVGCC
jgi:hypothetical protein